MRADLAAQDQLRWLVIGIGADLIAEDGEAVRAQDVVDARRFESRTVVQTEEHGPSVLAQVIEKGLVLDQPIVTRFRAERPGHITRDPQTGESLRERRALGITDELDHRS